jgi:hypothetical protein
MTLLVGIRCKEGVIVAADQAVTFTASDRFTISHLACKISVLKNRVIIAGTGSVGAAQRFCETAEQIWDQIDGKAAATPLAVCRTLAAAGIRDFQGTQMPAKSLGALMAFPCLNGGGPQLCEFGSEDFQPELKDSGTWFVSMGSGQLLADSYLGFMRDVFWRKGMPSLQHGLFAAAWVMRQSIRVAPGYVSEPVDIAVLEGAGARKLDLAEVRYHMDVADQATEHFGKFDPPDLPPASVSRGESVARPTFVVMPEAPPMPEPPPMSEPPTPAAAAPTAAPDKSDT